MEQDNIYDKHLQDALDPKDYNDVKDIGHTMQEAGMEYRGNVDLSGPGLSPSQTPAIDHTREISTQR